MIYKTAVVENLTQILSGDHVALVGVLSSYDTSEEYGTVKELLTTFFASGTLQFTAQGADIVCKVVGDEGDSSFDRTVVGEFTITSGAGPSVRPFVGPYSAIRIMAKSASPAVLDTTLCLTDINPD